jgi:hypothetical protein
VKTNVELEQNAGLSFGEIGKCLLLSSRLSTGLPQAMVERREKDGY